MHNRFFVRSFILIMVLLLQAAQLWAQGDPGQDPDVKVPFDGGLSLLLAAGVGYGLKKAYDGRRAEKSNTARDQQ